MDSLELSVESRALLHRVFLAAPEPLAVDAIDPVGDERVDLRPVWRFHAGPEGLDVLTPERRGAFLRIQLVRREMQPDRLDGQAMNLAYLCHGDVAASHHRRRVLHGMGIDPLGGPRIPLDFEILLELFAPDSPTLEQE